MHQRLVDVVRLPGGRRGPGDGAAEQAALEAAAAGLDRDLAPAEQLDAAVLRDAAVQSGQHPPAVQPARAGRRRDRCGRREDWAVRAIKDGLGGQNCDAVEVSSPTAGEQRPGPRPRCRSWASGDPVIGKGAPGTPTARLALVAPLRDHLAEGRKLRGMFKSSEPSATPSRSWKGHSGRSAGRRRPSTIALVCAAAAGRRPRGDPRPGLGHGRARRSRARRTSRCSSRSPGSSTLRPARPGQPVPGRGHRRPDRRSSRPVVAAADQPGRVAGVRRRAARGAAAGRGRGRLGRPGRASADGSAAHARLDGAPPELAEAAAAVVARDADAYAEALAGLADVAARAGRADRLRRARHAAARGPPRPGGAAAEDPRRLHRGRTAGRLGRRLAMGPGQHVLPQPAPARPGAAARGGAVGHDRAGCGRRPRRWPRSGPGGTACAG